ncbi:MAG: 50S ribosomal protein L17 [Planctomycetes bacterium]|nr:50S ribosomal protein L17 [Planctomycetota bacterium]
MRHSVRGRKLNRTAAHRVALRRNLVQSLIEHGQVRTTLTKAKEVRAMAERLVTLAINGSLAARQRAITLLNDRAIIAKENQEDYDGMSDAKRERVLRTRSGRRYRASITRPGVKFTAESVIHRLFSEIGPRMTRRNRARNCSGGYTRVIKLADRRVGDGTRLAVLQLVGEDDKPRSKTTDKTERKRRAKVKYAVYAGKPLTRRGRRRSTKRAAGAQPARSKSGE